MIVALETTPNPSTRKFLPGRHLSSVPREYSLEARGENPLVHALFDLGGIRTILINEDAISVTLDDENTWDSAVQAIREVIADMFTPLFALEPQAPEEAGDFDEADATVVETIKDLLETRIRPAVARDGGDITFRSFRDGVLGLTMRGACSGCPSSSATLQNGIQTLMRYFVPEVREVVAA
jgi:Fe-S cluster biogenesis protein NfuA